MELSNIINEVTAEDLGNTHWKLAGVVGMENLYALSMVYGGTALYIPSCKDLFKKFLYRKALSEYDGTNMNELAVKYGFSVSTMYRLVRDERQTQRTGAGKNG